MHTLSPDTATAVLDALHSHVALLSADGTIRAVNRAWREFMSCNGGEPARCQVGANYVEVCRTAALQGDALAQQVLEGLGAVRSGHRNEFVLEYPCHSPDRQRWFILRVSRCASEGSVQLIVAHDDITERVVAEHSVREAKNAVDVANRRMRLALRRERLVARTDALTGAHNRRYFFEVGERLFRVAARYDQPLSAVLFDIDHFKQVNDRHGHHAGDLALVHLVGVMREHLRRADVFARFGGEEFIALLPQTDLQQAHQLAEQIRRIFAERPVYIGGETLGVTVSAGVAGRLDEDADLGAMIRRADQAMYRAKRSGRDRVVLQAA
jgi:diguanylate cyclase (GGDEF)-like protein